MREEREASKDAPGVEAGSGGRHALLRCKVMRRATTNLDAFKGIIGAWRGHLFFLQLKGVFDSISLDSSLLLALRLHEI